MSNVSLLHEAPLEVLRDAPHAILDLLRVAGDSTAQRQGLEVTVVDSELTDEAILRVLERRGLRVDGGRRAAHPGDA